MFTRSDRLRPNTTFNRFLGTESDKSLIDDLYLTESCKHESKLVLRSAEGKLLSEDLYLRGQQCHAFHQNTKPPIQSPNNKLIHATVNGTPPHLIPLVHFPFHSIPHRVSSTPQSNTTPRVYGKSSKLILFFIFIIYSYLLSVGLLYIFQNSCLNLFIYFIILGLVYLGMISHSLI